MRHTARELHTMMLVCETPPEMGLGAFRADSMSLRSIVTHTSEPRLANLSATCVKSRRLTALEASAKMKQWFLESPELSEENWNDDKVMLSWMAQCNEELESKVNGLAKDSVVQEVFQVLTAGGGTGRIGTAGIVEGISKALSSLSKEEQDSLRSQMMAVLK